MAGGGSGNNVDIFNNSKPAKGTTEKKKRKRPSKKVPTTVLEANSNNFMNLVQKLTGSADELNHHAAATPNSNSPSPSPYSSPSNHTTQQEEPYQQSYYQQYLHSSSTMDDDSGSSHNYNYNPAPYSSGSYSHQDDGMARSQPMDNYGYDNYRSVGGSGGYVGSGSGSRVGGDDQDNQHDLYQGYTGRYNSNDTSDYVGYPSSSRAMENDISPFSWRDPMNHNSTSDYWYHVDPMPAMRAS
ncbi:hypothetical protein KC19_7G123800 [Ceratodon purpureus]|uniref:VQ domain-containing protein n=1 Tax=Ceratodon purpureus TaxID=3225 RepID=A0A8T0H8X0_CERPU|nr:hypothetical protein KC19_7G123800 [Ceratodon purpureus]